MSMLDWWRNLWPSGPVFKNAGELLGSDRPSVNLSWVPVGWACADKLTSKLMQVPFSAYVTRDGIREPAPDDSKYGMLARFLNQWPSDLMNRQQFWAHMWGVMNADGNAYALIHRSGRIPVRLEPVTRIYPPNNYGAMPLQRPTYRFTEYPGEIFEADDVLAMHGPGWNARDNRSPSPFMIAAKRLGVLEEGLSRLKKDLNSPSLVYRAAHPRGELLSNSEVTDIAAFNRKSLDAAQSRGEDPVLWAVEVEQGNTQQRSARGGNVEELKWQAEEVCRVFGVPPRSIGILSAGMRSEASLQGQMADLAESALEPRAEAISAEVTSKFLAARDINGGYELVLDVAGQARGTLNERAEAANNLVSRAAVWSPNEARTRLFSMPPIEGEDEIRVPTGAADSAPADGNRSSPEPPATEN